MLSMLKVCQCACIHVWEGVFGKRRLNITPQCRWMIIAIIITVNLEIFHCKNIFVVDGGYEN